jgi:hypothetical protein
MLIILHSLWSYASKWCCTCSCTGDADCTSLCSILPHASTDSVCRHVEKLDGVQVLEILKVRFTLRSRDFC